MQIKFIKPILTVLMLFSSVWASAVQMSHQQYEALKSRYRIAGEDMSAWQQQADISAYLDEFSIVSRLVISSKIMHQMAQQANLTPAHKQWLNSLLAKPVANMFQLQVSAPEHPRKWLTVIDLPSQAKATIKLVNINQLRQQIDSLWQQSGFFWQDWLKPEQNNYQALVDWIDSLSASRGYQVASYFEQSGLDLQVPDNRILLALIRHKPSLSLLSTLWQRPVDTYTYKAVAQIPVLLTPHEAITQLAITSQSKALQSQSFLLLARHYSIEPEAQQVLVKALKNPQSYWMAAAALSQINDPDFKQRLREQFSNLELEQDRAIQLWLEEGDAQ